MIPLSEPSIGELEIAYVQRALDSGWVSSAGPFVTELEDRICRLLDAEYAVATSSGTAALHLALLACGIEEGDEVLVPTLTFIAPANAVRYAGGHPVFIDADPETWQMDVGAVQRFLDESCRRDGDHVVNKETGRKVVATLPVNILGHPVDMDPLLEAAAGYGLKVIEDATESLGATYRGRPVGTLGTVGCLSFNGNKLVTTGGGGMVVTNDRRIAEISRHLSTQAKSSADEYIHDRIGFNYRMSNVAAAIGCAQLERLDGFLEAKKRIADGYFKALGEIEGLEMMPEASWAESAYWLYTIGVGPDFGLDARTVQRSLATQGIQTRPLWQPLHLSPAHEGSLSIGGEIAERIYRTALSLPSSVSLTPSEQSRVTAAIASLKV